MSDRKIVAYDFVRRTVTDESDIASFSAEVNEQIRKGWEPQGGVCIKVVGSGGTGIFGSIIGSSNAEVLMWQSIVRYEKEITEKSKEHEDEPYWIGPYLRDLKECTDNLRDIKNSLNNIYRELGIVRSNQSEDQRKQEIYRKNRFEPFHRIIGPIQDKLTIEKDLEIVISNELCGIHRETDRKMFLAHLKEDEEGVKQRWCVLKIGEKEIFNKQMTDKEFIIFLNDCIENF